MKKMNKLFVLLFLSIVFILPIKVNATTYTIDQLKSMYPNGYTFSEVYSYRHNSDDNPGYIRQDVQRNCAGFAATMYYKFYGIDHYWATRITDVWQVGPGDIVRYLEPSKGANTSEGHSVFVISKSGDKVTVAEANYGEYQKVKWGRQISISELSVGFDYIDKGLYPIGGVKITPTVEKASNFKATYNTSTNKISASWNRVSRASDYNVLVFTEADAKNNNFTNPVAKENPTYNIGSVAPFSFDKSGTFYIYLQTILDEYKSDLVGPIIIKKISVSSVSIKDKPTGNIYVGDTFKLTGEKIPSDANYQSTLTWSSSDDNIATVGSSSGKVTVKKAGKVTITLTSGNGKKATYTFTAIEKIPATSISLNTNFKDLLIGETYQLNATVLPSNTTDKPVVWTSSDTSIATVSSNGLVKGISSGDVEITATAGSQNISCRVIVSSSAIEKIDFSLPFAIEGEQYYMRADVTPSDANTSGITWTSSNSNIFSVESSTGNIALMKAKKGGEVTLTIKAPNGVKKELKIKVYSKPNYISVTAPDPVYIGNTFDLIKDIRADYEYYNDFYYESSNPEIIEVLSNGKLHAKAKGSAYIYLRSRIYKNTNAGTSVTVKDIEPTGISLNKTSMTLVEGNNETLTATITPSNATNKTITWTSSNTSIATVSNGKVTALKAGTATITAKTSNGMTTTCKLTITAKEVAVSGISLNKTTLSLVEGNNETLSATITPSNATNKTITWTSSNTSIVTVSNGKITGVNPGTATITAKTNNGKTATCTVTVTKRIIDPTSISLDKSSLELTVAEKYNFKVTILPANANNNKSYSFTSSNPQVVSINGSEIHALKVGTATITVKTANGKIGTCTVTVKAKNTEIAVTGISLNKTSLSLVEGNNETLTSTILPSNATNKTVTWTSSNTSIATVANGEVTAIKAGTTTITAKTNNGKTITCTVTVTAKTNTNTNTDSNLIKVYRMYNPINGEHLYTTDAHEVDVIFKTQGWGKEGIGWYTAKTGTPVYRLYNPKLGNHLYTSDQNEIRIITRTQGWVLDFNGEPVMYASGTIPIYRLFNPGLQGQHHLTTDENEYKVIPKWGWQQEGEAMKAQKIGVPEKTHYYK